MNVYLDLRDDGVAHVIVDSPPLNILTHAVLKELRAAFATVSADASARVLLLSAHGKHFSAGASVEEHLPPVLEPMLNEFTQTVLDLDAVPVPVVAAVQGRCLGGAFELVLAADLVMAADSAQFGQPEVQLGVIAPVACALLPRRVGMVRAAEILYTGDAVPAWQLAASGLVARITSKEELAADALALAQNIARHSRTALLLTKRALRGARELDARQAAGFAQDLYLNELMRTHDATEGLSAFLEKRRPIWSHQ